MSFRSLVADLVLGGNLGNLYSLTGTITLGDPNLAHIVLDGESDAILFYESAHNLVLSIAPAAGVTPFGTHYPAGVAWFDFNTQTPVATWDEADGFSLSGSTLGQSVTLTSAPTNYNSGGAPAGTTPAFVRALSSYLVFGLPAMDALVFSGPISPASIDSDLSSIAMAFSQGQALDGAIGAFQFLSHTVTATLAQLDKTGFNIKAGSVTAPHPGGAIGQSETWQTPAVNANWTTAGTTVPLRYRKEGIGPNGIVRLDGEILTTGAGPWNVGTTLATLAAAYAPASIHRFITPSGVLAGAGSSTVQINTFGQIITGVSYTAAGQSLYFDGVTFPLD